MDMVRGARLCWGDAREEFGQIICIRLRTSPPRFTPQAATPYRGAASVYSTVFHSRHLGSYYCDTL